MDLLEKRKFVVLQGAPGTGKTWNAQKLIKKYTKHFFTQFHAETTYSDFIEGIEPNLDKTESDKIQFKDKKGTLREALEAAEEVREQGGKVLLIIDEINRANLSNVLGPVFFLFEQNSGDRKGKIKIGGKEYSEIPDNLHVIATMNTADRSIAVVDFALRRRFSWLNLRPRVLENKEIPDDLEFMKDIFKKFDNIFKDYASDEELNLQPGQSYFLVKKSNKLNIKEKEEEHQNLMKERLIYELMPLIKEYLAEGYLLKAKEAFSNLFMELTGEWLYE